jgi:hypothetical protein
MGPKGVPDTKTVSRKVTNSDSAKCSGRSARHLQLPMDTGRVPQPNAYLSLLLLLLLQDWQQCVSLCMCEYGERAASL